MAYIVGLTATDGCLITGRRAINFKSADRELVATYLSILGRSDSIAFQIWRGGNLLQPHLRALLASARVRYVLVAALSLSIGGATVVSAAPTHPIFSLADRVDDTKLAAVDAAGQVSTVDAGANTHLASIDTATGKLSFDGTNALRVTQQGTLTLSTSDFPDAGTHSRLDTANTKLASIDAATGKLKFDASGNLQVEVTNLPTAKDPDSAHVPFQQEVTVTIADGSSFLACCGVAIPAGKRLVIEHVSVHARLVNDRLVQAIVFTSAAGNFGIATDLIINDNGDWFWVGSQQMRLYADGPSSASSPTLSFQAGRSGSSGARNVVFDISGYLVDL